MNKKEVLIEIGKNLRAERNRVGLSQDGLAVQAGICAGKHIGKIERGEANPSIFTVISLMKILNISFDKLYNLKK